MINEEEIKNQAKKIVEKQECISSEAEKFYENWALIPDKTKILGSFVEVFEKTRINPPEKIRKEFIEDIRKRVIRYKQNKINIPTSAKKYSDCCYKLLLAVQDIKGFIDFYKTIEIDPSKDYIIYEAAAISRTNKDKRSLEEICDLFQIVA